MHRSVIEDRAADLFSINRAIKDGVMAAMHTSIPGIIQSFDPALQTATVQTAIRRKVRGENGEVVDEKDPLLTDVPVLFLGGGTSALTFPVKVGDECLVVFAELNIDAWYQSGDVQNQVYPRSHSLSDGFAIVGFRSKPNALPSVADDMPEIDQLRVKDRLVANLEGKATSAEDSDKLGGKLPGAYADSEHNHDLVYSKLNHNHDGEYSGIGHLHDELYAKLGHNHDDKYSYIGHNHDDVYSLKDHRHDDLYAALMHKHDADYADINHDHDELYSKLGHNHDELYAKLGHGHLVQHIVDFPLSMPASDVYEWAKEPLKPAYSINEIDGLPELHIGPDEPDGDEKVWIDTDEPDIPLTTQDIGAAPLVHSHGDITNEGRIGEEADKVLVTGVDGIIETIGKQDLFNSHRVVESGSNANGHYVKFEDGTMICHYSAVRTDIAMNNAYGSLFQGGFAWTYPVPFVGELPTVVCGQMRWGTGLAWGAILAIKLDYADIRGIDISSRSAGTDVSVSVFAVGRWKE